MGRGSRSMFYHRIPRFQHGVEREKGGGPRVVVSTAAFHARARGSVPGLGDIGET